MSERCLGCLGCLGYVWMISWGYQVEIDHKKYTFSKICDRIISGGCLGEIDHTSIYFLKSMTKTSQWCLGVVFGLPGGCLGDILRTLNISYFFIQSSLVG